MSFSIDCAAERFRLPLDLANISVTSAPQRSAFPQVSRSISLAATVDGGSHPSPSGLSAMAASQFIRGLPNRGTRTDPFAAYCLGHVGLICFEERSSGVIPPGRKQRNPCVRGARRTSRPPCADPFLQSDREGQTSLGASTQVGFWSRAVMPGRRDQVVF